MFLLEGPLQESAVWIDETQTYSTLFGRNRASSPIDVDEIDDPLGISDESNESVLLQVFYKAFVIFFNFFFINLYRL